MDTEDLYNSLLTLVERSESRIDKTNMMIQQLVATCHKNMEMYDKHLTSLEHSRDTAQENVTNLVDHLKDAVRMVDDIKKDHDREIAELNSQISSLIKEKIAMTEAYIRLSERTLSGSGSAQATIKMNQ